MSLSDMPEWEVGLDDIRSHTIVNPVIFYLKEAFLVEDYHKSESVRESS